MEANTFLELRAYLDYRRIDEDLTFWRTHSGHEVDFVIGNKTAIEVKSSKRISQGDLKGLLALSEETKLTNRIVVSNEPRERTTDEGITILPVEKFLDWLWSDQFKI